MKINPKEQTDKLNEARFQFLLRNPEKLEELKKLYTRNEEKRRKAIVNAASDNLKLQAAWDFFLADTYTDKEYKDEIEKLTTYPAANVGPRVHHFIMQREHVAESQKLKRAFDMTPDELDEAYLEYLCQHARDFFIELTNGHPARHLLIGVDMSRTKEVILAEVGELITQHQNRAGLGLDIPQERLKWLAVVDELLAVWDAWRGYPQKECFHLIARKLKIQESTVKARWKLASRLIRGENFSTEKAFDMANALCANCKEQKKCYQIRITKSAGKENTAMEFIPCAAYKKIVGKNSKKKDYDFESIMSKNVFTDWWTNEHEEKKDAEMTD